MKCGEFYSSVLFAWVLVTFFFLTQFGIVLFPTSHPPPLNSKKAHQAILARFKLVLKEGMYQILKQKKLVVFKWKPVGRSKVCVEHVKTTVPPQSSRKAVYSHAVFCRMGTQDLLLPERQTKLKSPLIQGKWACAVLCWWDAMQDQQGHIKTVN